MLTLILALLSVPTQAATFDRNQSVVCESVPKYLHTGFIASNLNLGQLNDSWALDVYAQGSVSCAWNYEETSITCLGFYQEATTMPVNVKVDLNTLTGAMNNKYQQQVALTCRLAPIRR